MTIILSLSFGSTSILESSSSSSKENEYDSVVVVVVVVFVGLPIGSLGHCFYSGTPQLDINAIFSILLRR